MVIGFCDDELSIREELVQLCKQYMKANLSNFEIITFNSGEEVIEYDKTINILFLDIQMKGINGLETAEKLRQKDENMIIVFLTGYINFMQAGYRVKAFRYLLKPVKNSEFTETLLEAIHEVKKDSRIIIGTEGEIIFLKLKEIIYIECINRYTVVRTKKKYFETLIKMNKWEDILNSGDFYRVHKSYIVNLEYIKEIGKEIILDNEEKVEVSVRKVGQLKKVSKAYRRRNAR